MAKTELIKIAQRLEIVIKEKFGSQTKFAEKAQISQATISDFLAGKRELKKSIADKMQENAGVSADYLLKGIEPMMVEISNERVSSVLSSLQANDSTKRGTANHYILDEIGTKNILTPSGIANIADITFNGIQNPAIVRFASAIFKKKYGYNGIVTVVLNNEYVEDNRVLIRYNKHHYRIAKVSGDCFFDVADNTQYVNDNIDVLGAIYCEIIHH